MRPRRRLPDEVRRHPVAAGERVLTGAVAEGGTVVAATRDALYVGDRRVPWEQVQHAEWDSDTDILEVAEIGEWGEVRPAHRLQLPEPGHLLEVVRERVTASVVLERHVPLRGRRGVRVIARRAPGRDAPMQWVYEFDEGVDPNDPQVRQLAREALVSAQEELGS